MLVVGWLLDCILQRMCAILCCVRMISDSCFVSLFLFVSIVVGMFYVDTALLAHYLGQCYCYCNFSGFTVHSNQPMPLTD